MNHKIIPARTRSNAKTMRSAMTDAELKLWNAVRAHRLMDLPFRRQMPILGYIVDFACPSRRLTVELDGSQHGLPENAEADLKRTQAIEQLGWTVLRFWNDDVLKDIDGVCQHIVTVAGLADIVMEERP
jgi:very-short-patch-repair endonuclease